MPQMNQTQTTVKEFFIVGFPGLHPQHYKLMGTIFFLIYVTTVVGNSLLVALFFIERRLQKPMYIIMLSLALSDIGFCTVALPKVIGRYWLDDGAIPFHICFFQRFLIHYFGTLNSLIMLAMSLDRYLAICFPLRYPTLMTNRTMGALTGFSWVSAAVSPAISVGISTPMPFCGPNRIIHCYCDTMSTTSLVCADARQILSVSTGLAMFVLLVPLILILSSYISIIVAVLKVADAQGRQKTFSTCATQLCIISIYYLPRFGVYLSSLVSYINVNPDLRISLTLFYSLFPPLLNPLIYCYRTTEIKDILSKWFCRRNAISQTPIVTTVSK
ncbi:olfactory receptor 1-like [Anguilla anguilla]|uniref:olfactory receptor 1-like n=1 Tax=Anguilla anguilla TaxID=7936 RepID=UPI0015ADC1D1|nr:olfactory receptor 1-like [Anguilla anguilla]XP_035290648.1 olfactory receptor 1-like [Anguilla anguilla]